MRKILGFLLATLLLAAPASAAGPGNPFLYNPGTSNNGLYVAELLIISTELDSLAGGGSVIISSVNGSSGVFNNSNTGQGLWAILSFTAGVGGTQPTCTAGGNLALWFLQTTGSTYEITTAAPPRAPDAIIPLPTAILVDSQVYNSPVIQVPALPFKVLVQNNCAAATGGNFPAYGTTAPKIYMGIFTTIY